MTAVTPPTESADGPRLNHFRLALHKMLQATIKQCSGAEGTEQCFPFAGLAPAQLQQLDEALRGELERLYGDIQTPVEQLLMAKSLPAKLNEIDSYLATHTTGSNSVGLPSSLGVEEQVLTRCTETKIGTRQRLQAQLETARWQVEQRRKELASRQEAIKRRSEHLRDAQRLYEIALEGVATDGSGELEGLVDRMIHQTVPIAPADPSASSSL